MIEIVKKFYPMSIACYWSIVHGIAAKGDALGKPLKNL
jgi:hypothetical protein